MNSQHLMAFKMAGIEPDKAVQLCNGLSEEMLARLTAKGKLDRRLIKPILSIALNNGGINDENIERILNDWNFMVSLKKEYCD